MHYEEVENEEPLFLASGGFVGLSSDFGLKEWVFALALYGPLSVGKTIYPEKGPQRYQLVSRDIMLISYSLAVAWGTDDLGLGLNLHYWDMPKNRLQMVVDADNQSTAAHPHESPYDVLVTLNTQDRFTPGLSLGAWYRPSSSLEVALAGRVLPLDLEGEGSMKIEGQGELLEGKLFEMEPDDSAGFNLSYAPSAHLGLRYFQGASEDPNFDLELNLVWEGWSVMDAYRVETPPAARVEELNLQVELDDIELPREWSDVWSLRLGGSWAPLPGRFKILAGGFYETAAVPEELSYMDFMSFDRFGLGGGIALSFGAIKLDLAYQHIFVEPRALSEMEGEFHQQRPTSPCKAPYTGPRCDQHYLGKQGPVVNAGTFLAGYDLFSLALGGELPKLF